MLLLSSAQAGIWPQQLGDAKRLSVGTVKISDQKLWNEYGLQEAEQALTQARKEALGFTEKGGVLVEEIVRGSFADDVGIAEGDILLSINRQHIESVEDVKRIQGNLKPGDPVVFHVMRSDSPAVPGRRSNQGGGRAQRWIGQYLAGTMPNIQ